MIKTRHTTIAIAAVLLIAAVLTADRIIIYTAAKLAGVDIKYSSIKNNRFKIFTFSDFSLTHKKSGMGINAKRAIIQPAFGKKIFDSIKFKIDLKDVRFLTRGSSKVQGYQSISDLISAPLASHWRYNSINGNITLYSDCADMEGLFLTGDEIKMSFDGTVFFNNTINGKAAVFFSQKALGKIPAELSDEVLKDEPDGWKGLSVTIGGNFKSPSIEISAKSFRFKINSLTVK